VRAYLLVLFFLTAYGVLSTYLLLNTPVGDEVIPYGVP
jgi:hypothetical protein